MSCVTAVGLVEREQVPGVLDLVQGRVGQLGVQAARRLLDVHHVAVAVGDRRGDGDRAQPAGERRIELVGVGPFAQLQLEGQRAACPRPAPAPRACCALPTCAR